MEKFNMENHQNSSMALRFLLTKMKKEVSLTARYSCMKPIIAENATVRILDERDVIIRKFKKAVTDSDSVVRAGADKPAITNLMSIYGAFTGKNFEEIEKEFDGKGYGEFKLAVGEACVDALGPVQAEFKRILADKKYLEDIMAKGAMEASRDSRRTMSKVRRRIGFTDMPRF